MKYLQNILCNSHAYLGEKAPKYAETCLTRSWVEIISQTTYLKKVHIPSMNDVCVHK